MAPQEHQVEGIIFDEVNDEIRLYECARKYETIVKQFEELVGIMNNGTTIPEAKWRKSRRRSASGGRASVSSNQSNRNEAIVQTVTRFLHELKTNPTDSSYSGSTTDSSYPESTTYSSYPGSTTYSSYPGSITYSSYPGSTTYSSYPGSTTYSSYPGSTTDSSYPGSTTDSSYSGST